MCFCCKQQLLPQQLRLKEKVYSRPWMKHTVSRLITATAVQMKYIAVGQHRLLLFQPLLSTIYSYTVHTLQSEIRPITANPYSKKQVHKHLLWVSWLVRVYLQQDVLGTILWGPVAEMGCEGADITVLSYTLSQHKIQTLFQTVCKEDS